MIKRQISKLIITSVILLTSCSPRQLCDGQAWADLNRNTIWGYRVPYTLRYDPSEWVCEEKPGWGDKEFYSTDGGLEITVWSNSTDKNLTPEFLEDRFQEVASAHLEKYDDIEFLPSDIVSVNDVTFLYHCALGASGEKERQIFQYTYSTDAGCVSLFCTAERRLTEADEKLIAEFTRGFSTNGKGCKGIAPLRTVKNVLDIFGS